jgi:hypothetical protein
MCSSDERSYEASRALHIAGHRSPMETHPMKTSTTETEIMLLLTAAQLLQAADKAPGNLRKRLQLRGEQLLNEADAEGADARKHAEEEHVPYYPPPYAPERAERGDGEYTVTTPIEVEHNEVEERLAGHLLRDAGISADVVAVAAEPGSYSGT